MSTVHSARQGMPSATDSQAQESPAKNRQNDSILPIPTPPQSLVSTSSTTKRKHEDPQTFVFPQASKAIRFNPLPTEVISPGGDIWPPVDTAEMLCSIYRNELSIHFPFVTPPNKPVPELQTNHPCLFKAMVMAASYQNRALQMQGVQL
ncbi:tRNA processing endoribonuclease [Penicillium argentinense]|uniref:tRNA processing endoribonuclease n=1 Tax=Penicillium argentinense TaxID=1131581 RepID=A0A9W9EWD4_9EURO|nr:tRNA processing endoribonuclease [Penicillium argentinense]KAJ5089075.1 tRNA processing endoribonuclease [Penicillium argentinense]